MTTERSLHNRAHSLTEDGAKLGFRIVVEIEPLPTKGGYCNRPNTCLCTTKQLQDECPERIKKQPSHTP